MQRQLYTLWSRTATELNTPIAAEGRITAEIKEVGCVEGLRTAEFSCAHIKGAGYTLQEAKLAGYTPDEIKLAGYVEPSVSVQLHGGLRVHRV